MPWQSHASTPRTEAKWQNNHCPISNHFILLHLRFHWGTSEGGCALSSGLTRAALGFILPAGLGVEWADSASRVFNFPWATEGPETDSSPGKGRDTWKPTPSHWHLWSLWSYLNNGASWTKLHHPVKLITESFCGMADGSSRTLNGWKIKNFSFSVVPEVEARASQG